MPTDPKLPPRSVGVGALSGVFDAVHNAGKVRDGLNSHSMCSRELDWSIQMNLNVINAYFSYFIISLSTTTNLLENSIWRVGRIRTWMVTFIHMYLHTSNCIGLSRNFGKNRIKTSRQSKCQSVDLWINPYGAKSLLFDSFIRSWCFEHLAVNKCILKNWQTFVNFIVSQFFFFLQLLQILYFILFHFVIRSTFHKKTRDYNVYNFELWKLNEFLI